MLVAPNMNKFAKILIITILLNAIMPYFSAHSAMAQIQSYDKESLEQIYGEKILICTTAGYIFVTIDEFIDHYSGENNKNQKLSNCPYCNVAFQNIIGVSDKISSKNYFELKLISQSFTIKNSQYLQRISSKSISSRGPPVIYL